MPKKEKTRPEPEKPSQDKIDEALRENWSVRVHMRDHHINRWGLLIIRGSYLSQSRWEQFIAQFHKDMQEENLQFEDDSKLKDTMNFPIIENKKKLHGATWMTARSVFDTWIEKDQKENPLPPETDLPLNIRTLAPLATYQIKRAPFWNYCIFVNEASICSVLDYKREKQWRRSSFGDYWFMLIPSTARWEFSNMPMPNWKGFKASDLTDKFKKVKMVNFIKSYAEICREYDGFDRIRLRGGDDICAAL